MDYKAFIQHAAAQSSPPDGISEPLRALWHAQKGDWNAAHSVAQDIADADGSWIHANLHREEGDPGNARYWYGRAGRPESKLSVEEERSELIRHFLGE